MKKVFRKVAIFVIAMLTMSVAAHAQEKGDMAAGGNLVVGAGDAITNFGIGAKFQYNVMDPLRLEGSFTYFFEKSYISMWDLSVNGHWLFPIADQIKVYPLAGLSILGVTANIPKINLGEWGTYGGGSASSSDFAFNIGGGIDYKLTEKLILNAELKYKLSSNWDRLLLSVGVAYMF